jgi:hypothetical protein
MPRRQKGSQPTWTDLKARLSSFDRLGLLGLIQDLYVAHKDNQTFLHARFGLGEDILKPYKETLDRWLWPDVIRNQDASVIKAKQAISSFKKAVDDPAGLADLMVFYCECAAGFCNDVGYQDEAYFNALVRTGSEDHRPAIRQRPRFPDHPAGSRPRHQPQLRLWRRRRYGLPACQDSESLTTIARYASLPKTHSG